MIFRLGICFLTVFLLGGCSRAPLLHSNSSSTYERCLHQDEGALYGQCGNANKAQGNFDIRSLRLGGKYQFEKHLGIGIDYQHVSKVGSGINFTGLSLPLQAKFGQYYVILIPKCSYGRLSSRVLRGGSIRTSLVRLGLSPVVGVRIKGFDLQLNLNYYYQRYGGIEGDLVHDGEDQVERLRRLRSLHNLDPNITLAYSWAPSSPAFFFTFGGYNVLTKNLQFFEDRNIHAAFGVNFVIR